MEDNIILNVENVRIEFPGVLALDDVHLRVKKGTVHALMGENGAGKSTLMKILIGIYHPNKGKVTFKGEELKIENTHDALSKGIAMIHQELSPIPYMTVAENIYLGRETHYKNTGIINMKKMEKDTVELLERLNIKGITPRMKLNDLSIANIQMVEIAKAISYNSDLIIMDEPTSAITEKEVEHLFEIIHELKSKGISIIYITHKMDEVFKITDEVTVLRDGKFVGTELASNLNKNKLIEMMVGRELKDVFVKENVQIGDVVLSVRNYSKKGQYEDVSFDLRKGEILGFAGLMGAGRTEVMESVFGYRTPDSGDLFVNGKQVKIKSPIDAIRYKMALLTEDRKKTGLFLPLTVKDNTVIASLNKFMKKKSFINEKKIKDVCESEVTKMAIKTPSIDQKMLFLSGGNQQKVLISRWLLTDPDILILDEPTRGIDVGAKSEIHKLMSAMTAQGMAIIMISSELPEILGMSDRVLVMHEGRLTGELSREEATQERILQLATE